MSSAGLAGALEIRTAPELREAATTGRLREVPGIGPKIEARIVAALERESDARAPRGLWLTRARELVGGIAHALDAEAAGDVRRWCGTALVRATGSPEYVAALEPLPDVADERAVYDRLGVPWCPPELREAPFRGQPPALVEVEEVRGDLHCHTTWSDGRATVMEMGLAARARGYECDILPDGRLDLSDDVLAELDWVQASVHGGQRMPRAEMTKRVQEALHHPAVRCLSHPTGRIIDRRPENALDLDVIFELARTQGISLEVNGLPARLDLSGVSALTSLLARAMVVCSAG